MTHVVGALVANATGANPRGSGDAVTTVVSSGGEPSLLLPLLALAVMLVTVIATIVWWRRFGGWSPVEMTVTLQLTGREVDVLGAEIQRSSARSPAALAAHQRAVAALSTVLRRDDLAAVHEAMSDVRHELALSQTGATVVPGRGAGRRR